MRLCSRIKRCCIAQGSSSLGELVEETRNEPVSAMGGSTSEAQLEVPSEPLGDRWLCLPGLRCGTDARRCGGAQGSFSLGDLVQDLSELVAAMGGSGSEVRLEVPDEPLGDADHRLVLIEEEEHRGDDQDAHIELSAHSVCPHCWCRICRRSGRFQA